MKHAPMIPRGRGLELKTAAAPAAPAGGRIRLARKDEMKWVTRELTIDAKAIDEAGRTFGGQAAAFTLDQGGDVILKGAFRKTIADWKRSKKVMPLLDSHNGWSSVRNVVGKMLTLEESATGLDMTAEVIEGPDGDEIWRRIKGGFISGLSIGFRTIEERFPTEEEQRTGIWRFLKEIALKEISVCIWPMNTDAQIDPASLKDLLHAMRGHTLDADERKDLQSLADEIAALLDASAHADAGDDKGTADDPPPPAEPAAEPPSTAEGLAPEDPRRIKAEQALRDLKLRGLTA